jgi:hypothetical protein
MFAFADNPLSKVDQNAKYQDVLASSPTRVTSGVDFLVVEVMDNSNKDLAEWYFFTKPEHPADPGIVHVRLVTEGGEMRMESIGTHGRDEDAFNEFHQFVNKSMLQLIRGASRKSPNNELQPTADASDL